MHQLKRVIEEQMKRSDTMERESGQAIDDLQETKKMGQEAATRRNEAMSTGKVSDIYTEMNALNEKFSQQLKSKDKNIESLKAELEKAKQAILDRDGLLGSLKEELGGMKMFKSKALNLLAESQKQFQELEIEIEKRKELEKKMFDSFNVQTRELEQTKMSLVQSRLEIDTLHVKLEILEGSSRQNLSALGVSESRLDDAEEAFQSLQSELLLAKESLARSREIEKDSSTKMESLLEKMSLLENKLKSATEAEDNSKKALDDLALALKEVATEASSMKEKLSSTQEELEKTKHEAEQFKTKLKRAEEKLDELKREADLYKNTSERLRLEAEETLLAWSGKETGFVDCIKRAEEERDAAQQENSSLLESLKAAEAAIATGKQENHNLRDILKQALNEANVSKEAARIATAENSELKDVLHEKERALEFIIQENEDVKMNEAATLDSIKELKRLLYEEPGHELQRQNSIAGKELSEGKRLISEFGFNIKELRIPQHKSNSADKDGGDEDRNKQSGKDRGSARAADPLKGSIFDTDSPVAAPIIQSHHRRKSSAYTDGGGGDAAISDDFDSLDGALFEDSEGDKSSRKKKALLRRFGDLVMRRNYHHRKEASLESSV